MNNNTNNPFDFLGKLKEKGIISSSGKSRPKKAGGSKLSDFFKTVIEELSEANQDSNSSRSHRYEEAEQPPHSDVYAEDHADAVCDPEEEVDMRREQALKKKRSQEKIIQQQYAKASLSKKLADEETISKRGKVEEEESQDLLRVKNRRSNSKRYTGLLHHDKTGLRQAFVLKEILSKPIGLR